jgi:orotate phosphoribosyltransferase
MVRHLAESLRRYRPTGVCGPLLGGAFLAQLVALALQVEFYFTERQPLEEGGFYGARYRLPRSMCQQVRGKRIAIVDDVMSAGSAARGTHAELQRVGATPIAVGALLVLGTTGWEFFNAEGLPVEAVATLPYEIWRPEECPLCRSSIPLEELASPAIAP